MIFFRLLYPLLLNLISNCRKDGDLSISFKESGFPGVFGDLLDNKNLSEGEFFIWA